MLVAGCLPGSAVARTLHVSPSEPRTSLAAALQEARDGDRIDVEGGTYAAPVEISRSVELVGRGWPTIDGGGTGTVVRLRAAGIRLAGFRVRGSGSTLEAEDAAIAVDGPDAVVEDNRIEDALFGILLSKADRSVVRRNRIAGKNLDEARRGDAVRAWYTHDLRLEDNEVARGRDVVIWYSRGASIRRNHVHDGRYGIHFMFCDDALVESNRLADNSVGTYLMYSRRVRLRRNWIAGNRGPSGYGVGLKDMDDAVLEENLLLDNRIGVYIDNSPRELDAATRMSGNVVAYNDVGLEMQPLLRRNFLSDNSFADNQEQVVISGGGELRGNFWSVAGRGNYWSDYRGYDADGDGIGDLPYRAQRFFEHLADRRPELRLFLYSPVTAAIDLAARAFPLIQPQPKLEDERPLMRPAAPPGWSPPAAPRGWRFAAASGGLLAIAGLFSLSPSLPTPARRRPAPGGPAPTRTTEIMLHMHEVSRRFGRLVAVDRLSLDVRRGEAVALWGRNGAGKTTALRCALGLLSCDGAVQLGGLDVRAHGKDCRRSVGFVPQEIRFHDDLAVAETLEFYARLRGVGAPSLGALDRLGLADQLPKRVGELSGGRKRLLAFAVALLGDPPLLLLDEPMSNLDPVVRESFFDLLAEMKAAGTTLLFTSHRPEEVFRLADRVIVLERGRRVAEGAPGDVGALLGGGPRLHIGLPAERIEEALALLGGHGLASCRNGRGLHVAVAPFDKAKPIRILVANGFPVEDFDVEWEKRS
ncbi:MAG: nitrous oxide reductase family maturation protein NosD [Deltaproteobacteria bacterium]|nr:nitrous oxide reductase family maturation protein NosD [Deltaproteobacteria bacterium]